MNLLELNKTKPMKKNVTKKYLMKSYFLLLPRTLFVGIFLFSQLCIMAQQITVMGRVIDNQTREVMPGVNIVVSGTTVGTMTDANGRYSIAVPDKNAVLVFSFIGYSTREIPVEGKSSLDAELISSALSLEEVVVVGYGTQSRRNITGSVASANMKQLETLPVTNVSQAIRGTVAGVQFTDNGRPGG